MACAFPGEHARGNEVEEIWMPCMEVTNKRGERFLAIIYADYFESRPQGSYAIVDFVQQVKRKGTPTKVKFFKFTFNRLKWQKACSKKNIEHRQSVIASVDRSSPVTVGWDPSLAPQMQGRETVDIEDYLEIIGNDCAFMRCKNLRNNVNTLRRCIGEEKVKEKDVADQVPITTNRFIAAFGGGTSCHVVPMFSMKLGKLCFIIIPENLGKTLTTLDGKYSFVSQYFEGRTTTNFLKKTYQLNLSKVKQHDNIFLVDGIASFWQALEHFLSRAALKQIQSAMQVQMRDADEDNTRNPIVEALLSGKFNESALKEVLPPSPGKSEAKVRPLTPLPIVPRVEADSCCRRLFNNEGFKIPAALISGASAAYFFKNTELVENIGKFITDLCKVAEDNPIIGAIALGFCVAIASYLLLSGIGRCVKRKTPQLPTSGLAAPFAAQNFSPAGDEPVLAPREP